jgi:hypothetical protein
VLSQNVSGANKPQLFRSTDTGQTWDTLSLPWIYSDPVFGPWFDPGVHKKLYLSLGGGFFYSSKDLGSSWQTLSAPRQGLAPATIVDLVIPPGSSTELIAATGYGVFRSNDGGYSWATVGDSMVPFRVMSLSMDQDGVLYAASPDSGIFKISTPLEAVKAGTATAPNGPALYQNYPNPFNPMTKIQYSISKLSIVKMKIYDMLGREVATLVNEQRAAGNYAVKWDASNLPSGVYFYQLRAGSFVETKKLLLIK